MPIAACAQCGAVSQCKVCAQCRVACYCGADCQKAHWKEHRRMCSGVVRSAGVRPTGPDKDLARKLNALMTDTTFVENIFRAVAVENAPRLFFMEGHFIVIAMNIDAYLLLDATGKRNMIAEAVSRRADPEETNIRITQRRFTDPWSQSIIAGIPAHARPPSLDGIYGIVCEAHKGKVSASGGMQTVSQTTLFRRSFLDDLTRKCGMCAAAIG